MSAYEPPTIISTIYNPAFFETSATNTITQAQANALYLKKKTADTATALETFSAGIATTSLAASSFATVGTTLGVTGVLTASGNINTNSLGSIGGTLALGGLDIINLGTSGGRSAACNINTVGTGLTSIAGNVGQTIRKFGATQGTEYQYDNTNLIVGTQNMALYSTQSSGRLDIGTGARLLTGQGGGINIGSGSGGVANPITIGGASSNLTLNGGTIAIGNSFSTTTLNGVISFANLAIDSVDRAAAGTLSLGTSIANLVNISRSTIDTAILGTLSVAETTLFTGIATMTAPIVFGTKATANTQIGYRFQSGQSNLSSVIGEQNIANIGSLPIGNYILSTQFFLNNSAGWNLNLGYSSTFVAAQNLNYIMNFRGAVGETKTINFTTSYEQTAVQPIYVYLNATAGYALQFFSTTYVRVG